MASVSTDKNGHRVIQFYDQSTRRRTLRVGKVPLKTANSIRVHVERMVSAQITGHAVDDVTALWVSKLGQKMTKKLSTVGLIAVRESSTLGELITDFIRLRKDDVKPGTIRTYRLTEKHLTDFFGKDRLLTSMNAGDGKEFRAYLIGKGQAENTVRRTCGTAGD